MKKAIVITVVTFMTMACTPKCRKRVEYSVDAAYLACKVAAAELPEKEIGNRTPEQWCNLSHNFLPFFETFVKRTCPAYEKGEIKE